jgi:hypothetical protein
MSSFHGYIQSVEPTITTTLEGLQENDGSNSTKSLGQPGGGYSVTVRGASTANGATQPS